MIPRGSFIKRRQVMLGTPGSGTPHTPSSPSTITPAESGVTVLVVNSSHEMAKEITMQITLAMPGCSIMYAPTLDVARWILTRRKIDLLVSSAILPDGCVTKLREHLDRLNEPPDVVVVGHLSLQNAETMNRSTYRFAALRRIEREESTPVFARTRKRKEAQRAIKDLGADLRNDLNNPLQEIVAMVFVAQNTSNASPTTIQALDAIERAARNMALLVNNLEEKIRGAVEPQG